MGVTIHFEGRLRDADGYRGLLGVVRSIASEKTWLTEEFSIAQAKLVRVLDEKDCDYVGPTKGIVVYVDEWCEPVRLEFDKDFYIQEYVKTQFAGTAVHVEVVSLLRAIEPFFADLHVTDEGEYWESGDRPRLKRHITTINELIRDELKKNPHAEHAVRLPSGRIIDLCT